MKLGHFLTPHTRINSKWIKDISVRLKTIKMLKEDIRGKISDTGHSDIFSDISPWARGTKEKMSKWDYIKLKSICKANKTINKMKRQSTESDNIFTNDTSDKRLMSNIYKEVIQFNTHTHTHTHKTQSIN